MNPVDPQLYRDLADYDESLIAAAAFGTLDADEARELEVLLARSPEARAELAELRELAGNLALVAEERAPSADLRDRLEAAITGQQATTESAAVATPVPDRQPAPIIRLNGVWLGAIAAALAIALLSGVLLAQFVLFDDEDDIAAREDVALTVTDAIPDLEAQLTYEPDRHLFFLTTENLPPPPQDSIYQIWLIDEAGVAQPKGIMAATTYAVMADRDAFVAFAVTIEPGPLGSTGPTSEPFLVAPLESGDEG